MLKRDTKNGMIGGVCAGMAASFGVPILAVRFVALFGLLWVGLTFWAYLILWLCLPAGTEQHFLDGLNGIRRDPKNTVIAGVCGALAEYLGVNPVAIRIAWLVAIFWFGFGLVPYLVLWICIPKKTD